jgi:hypothetical protein
MTLGMTCDMDNRNTRGRKLKIVEWNIRSVHKAENKLAFKRFLAT